MRHSCLAHPVQGRYLNVQAWAITFCDGNRCAAALISFFEGWHNYKQALQTQSQKANHTAEAHGDPRTQYEGLWQWHTQEELGEGLLGLFGKHSIREAIQLLVNKGVITIHRNPNPRYQFDKTTFYDFHPEVCNRWLAGEGAEGPADPVSAVSPLPPLDSPKLSDRSSEIRPRVSENERSSSDFDPAITNLPSSLLTTTLNNRSEHSPERSKTGQSADTLINQPTEGKKIMDQPSSVPATLTNPCPSGPFKATDDPRWLRVAPWVDRLEAGGIPRARLTRPHDIEALYQMYEGGITEATLQQALAKAQRCQGTQPFSLRYVQKIAESLPATRKVPQTVNYRPLDELTLATKRAELEALNQAYTALCQRFDRLTEATARDQAFHELAQMSVQMTSLEMVIQQGNKQPLNLSKPEA